MYFEPTMANAEMNGHDYRNMGGLYQRRYDLASWLEFYLKHLQLIHTTADERTCGVDVNANEPAPEIFTPPQTR